MPTRLASIQLVFDPTHTERQVHIAVVHTDERGREHAEGFYCPELLLTIAAEADKRSVWDERDALTVVQARGIAAFVPALAPPPVEEPREAPEPEPVRDALGRIIDTPQENA